MADLVSTELDAPLPARAAAPAQIKGAGAGMILVLGMRRSGTTWLAKIFDSHPDVIYRHEPDIVLRNNDMPQMCGEADWARYAAPAREYLQRLAQVRTQKVAASLPVFRKSGQGALAHQFRSRLAFGLRAAEMALGRGKWPSRVAVPDLLGPTARPRRTVIKSVSALGRARLYAEAWPAARIIVILRHPCGQVASSLRGVEQRKFAFMALTDIVTTPQAQRIGLTTERLNAMTPWERLAADWMVMSQKVLDDLAGLPQVRVVRYRDLCLAPEAMARELFAFAGLSWNPQTAAFLVESTRGSARDGYYDVNKNPVVAEDRWRETLTPDQQRDILSLVAQAPAGQMFIESSAAGVPCT